MQPSTSSAPIRVLLADDDPVYRDGLPLVLSRERDIRVVGQATSVGELIDLARRNAPDVILSEMRLATPTGDARGSLALLTELPGVRLAILTSAQRDADAMQAIRAGARGYITKDATVADLADAIRRIARGEVVVPPRLAAIMLDELTTLSQGRQPSIVPTPDAARVTGREREVLSLLVRGATNRDIARDLVITENTVKVHLRNILEKLHLRNRQQAAAYAIGSGLVRLDGSEDDPKPASNSHHRTPPRPTDSRGDTTHRIAYARQTRLAH